MSRIPGEHNISSLEDHVDDGYHKAPEPSIFRFTDPVVCDGQLLLWTNSIFSVFIMVALCLLSEKCVLSQRQNRIKVGDLTIR